MPRGLLRGAPKREAVRTMIESGAGTDYIANVVGCSLSLVYDERNKVGSADIVCAHCPRQAAYKLGAEYLCWWHEKPARGPSGERAVQFRPHGREGARRRLAPTPQEMERRHAHGG